MGSTGSVQGRVAWPWWRPWVTALLAAMTLAGLGMPATAETPRGEGLRTVGKLPILWPKGEAYAGRGADTRVVSLALDSPARRAYQLFELCCTPGRPDRIGIQSFDLDTLRPLRYGTFEGSPIGTGFWGEWEYVLDEEGRRLFVPTGKYRATGGLEIDDIAVIDLAAFDRGGPFVAKRIGVPLDHQQVKSMNMYGIGYFREALSGAGKLILLFHLLVADLVVIHMVQWDAERGTADWLYSPAACSKGWGGAEDIPLSVWRSRFGPFIYTTCAAGSGSAVLRVVLDGSGRPVGERTLLGPVARETLADPATDRLVIVVPDSGTWTAWVADGPTMSFVGSVGLALSGGSIGLGLDAGSGRFYTLTPNGRVSDGLLGFRGIQGGLILTDARLTPAPQGVLFPEYSYNGTERISIDPAGSRRSRRVFLRRGANTDAAGATYPEGRIDPNLYPLEDFYLVIEDTVPVPRQPVIADLDRLTADVAEAEGVTGAAYNGLGSAYGTRLRLVGGVNAVTRPPDYPSPTEDTPAEPECWPRDREFVGGQVEQAHLSSLEASAAARYLDADVSSKTDLEKPVGRCQPRGTPHRAGDTAIPWPFETIDESAGRTWGFKDAICTGDGSSKTDAKDAYATNDLAAYVTCAQGRERVTAGAEGAPLSLGQVRVGESLSHVDVFRDAKGIHVRSEAIARGIEVPGLLRIESVRTWAIAHAGGRSGTAGTDFERLVCGIYSERYQTDGCLGGERLDQAIAAINVALGTRGSIRLPSPDAEAARGTPKGYAAEIRRGQNESLTAALLDNDYRVEWPGMEIVQYRDGSRGAGRQILLLAGVRASTTYGIYLLPAGSPPPGSLGPVPPPPPDIIATPGPVATAPPEPQAPPGGSPLARTLERARALLMRSVREGMLTSAIWLAIGLPFFLASRRRAFARSFSGDGRR